MPTPNARKGSETERMVAKYLREQGFAAADRRLREGRADDQGDIDGVPYTTIQVKYVAQPRLQSWVTDTLKQRDAAGNPFCLLVVRVKGKPPQQWDAHMPDPRPELPEAEAWTWTRMDLRLAAYLLAEMIQGRTYEETFSRSSLSSTPTTGPGKVRVTRG